MTTLNDSQRQAFLDERRDGLGASEVPALLGVDPYRTPLHLWADKAGIPDDDGTDFSEYIEWGHRLEGPVAAKFQDEHPDMKVWQDLDIRTGNSRKVQHPKIPRLFSHPDRFVDCPKRGLGVLQVKTTNAFKRRAWEEEVPLAVQVQVQAELMTTAHLGVNWAAVACLVGGNQYVEALDIVHHPKLQVKIQVKLAEFWKRILDAEPPLPTRPEDRMALERIYAHEEPGESIVLPPEALDWTDAIQVLDDQIKDLTAQKENLRNRIREAMGACAFGSLPGGEGGWTWKTVRQQVKAKEAHTREFRTLRRKRK